MDSFLIQTENQFGKIKNDSLYNWQSLVIEGSNKRAENILRYYVKREIKNTLETFTLEKENDIIKIIGYNGNYDILSK